jgi:hypothetical protein
MSEPRLALYFDRNRRLYLPGDELVGEYQVQSFEPATFKAVELTIVWHTEGKGDEDLDVHYFQRLEGDADSPVDLRRAQRFSTRLPASPLSYEGVIVKVKWCARVRVFLPKGKELLAEETFRLGHVPPASEPRRSPASEPRDGA